MFVREGVQIGGREFSIETGRVAKQAHGSVIVRYGDTMVLVTAVAAEAERKVDFLPLTVDYIEKTASAGRIPGGYFKREGRLTETETLTSRLIDRPTRPLFPKGWRHETQIVALVLSYDRENPSDVLAMTGASTALTISDVPWAGPYAGVRVARVEGQLVAFPTFAEQAKADINITMAASRDALVMVEGGADRVSEEALIDALFFGHQAVQPILDLQEKLRAAVGKPKRAFEVPQPDPAIAAKVKEFAFDKLRAAIDIREKQARYAALYHANKETVETLAKLPEFEKREEEINQAFDSLKKHYVRDMVLDTRSRLDGRKLNEIRQITCEVGVLPRTHGSGLFTRGETQGLVSVTLGTESDVQHIEALVGDLHKRFMLHYNFPPFSTGETKMMRGPSRREIGHGALAERALSRVLPPFEDFPYTIRIVSEILESNGSSSMASVCGGTLALMDAGVPVAAPVAGIAMGLIKEGDKYAVLSDILGDEDHLGDMDFKVTGTREGVTALQMDIKVQGLSREILSEALHQAREGRLYILDKMADCIAAPRDDLSPHAPRIITVQVKVDRIRDIIGPGGKMIRAIQEQTGCEINVEDDGTVSVASSDEASAKKAIEIIKGLTQEPEVGHFYQGVVRSIREFGAFVEIMPGTDGLVHISELANERVRQVEDVVHEGDVVIVKVIAVGRDGKIRLSRKEALGKTPEDVHNLTK
jgi:polyribonucleotide nucleotidyltransferase